MKLSTIAALSLMATLAAGSPARAQQAFNTNWSGDPVAQASRLLAPSIKPVATLASFAARNHAASQWQSFNVPAQDGRWTFPADGRETVTFDHEWYGNFVVYRWTPRGCPSQGGSDECQSAVVSRTISFPVNGSNYRVEVSESQDDDGAAYKHCHYAEGEGWVDCDKGYGKPNVDVFVRLVPR